jgi:hypothetical protein
MAKQSFVFHGSKDSIIFKTENQAAPYKIEITDGDYEAHYSIGKAKKEAFHSDLQVLIAKHGKTEFVWYSTDFFDNE